MRGSIKLPDDVLRVLVEILEDSSKLEKLVESINSITESPCRYTVDEVWAGWTRSDGHVAKIVIVVRDREGDGACEDVGVHTVIVNNHAVRYDRTGAVLPRRTANDR